jgi:threonine aldolase
MHPFDRRSFLKAGVAGAALGAGQRLLPRPVRAAAGSAPSAEVSFLSDGLHLKPEEYAELLLRLARENKAGKDQYLAGGAVAELEKRFAEVLGKEQAVFVPTGTLANHLAIRCLAGGPCRCLVQAESHIYNDSSDCVQALSHLPLVPLAAGQATFTAAQVEEELRRAGSGPYPVRVGVISVESPVRRKRGETFDHGEMKRIAELARKHDVKMHLDGARLFLASAYTGIEPAAYAACFDTVYVSLYKYFNAGTGAILAGPKKVVEQVGHLRKVFGGGLFQAWPYAAVALHYLDGFTKRFKKAIDSADALFAELEKHPPFKVQRIQNGTNICKLLAPGVDLPAFRSALQTHGVYLGLPNKEFPGFHLVVNESVTRRPAAELAKVFVEALPAK